MAKLSLQLKLGQQLTMTPQLQQAIRLLQMPVLELTTQLQEALESNVMLEQTEPAEQPQADSTVVAGEERDQSEWSDLYGSGRNNDNWTAGEQPQLELPDTSEDTLQEHLLWQLELGRFSPREEAIGQAIIDFINDDGYLTEDLPGILRILPKEGQFTLEEAESVLYRVQKFDPSGVGGRSPAECIIIQLEQLDPGTPGRGVALRVADKALELVAEHETEALRRQLQVTNSELDTALNLIRACHPKPGSTIQAGSPEYIVPDVYVRKQDGKWVVDINRSVAPKLKVNQAYADLLKGDGQHAMLKTQLQEARWLVRSLEIRNDTLMRVAMSIVERQHEFLEQGEESMKPMILKDIAEELELHESTISRVTTSKYMHTPRGVYEFRYFFSSQVGGQDGEDQSSTAIRARIRRLIGEENPAKPLSDSKITKLLDEEGIKVARRTVAKYREGMDIASSSERRQKAARS